MRTRLLVESPEALFASASASARFALYCLEPVNSHLRAKSSFVDPHGEPVHWHSFGDLEGPGWAANAVGGAHLLYRWGGYVRDESIRVDALRLLDHVLEDGFLRSDGLVWPYWDLARNGFCLNYTHGNDWLCPGSLAKVGVQMLDFAAELDDGQRASSLKGAAEGLSEWLVTHVPLVGGGWVPRRITCEGEPYPLTPEGKPDPIFEHSADGLGLVELYALCDRGDLAQELGEALVAVGGFWGSVNHDTYDDHENVAYAMAFRVMRRVARLLDRPQWCTFAYNLALPALQQFRMGEDRNGVVTRGLFRMEESWDTAYLWENAEVAQAYLEAWQERDDVICLNAAVEVLSAAAHHHYGPLGFLTEGVDWNNHVGAQHHVGGVTYGPIRYTEPLLNNLHLLGPTMLYLDAIGFSPPQA